MSKSCAVLARLMDTVSRGGHFCCKMPERSSCHRNVSQSMAMTSRPDRLPATGASSCRHHGASVKQDHTFLLQRGQLRSKAVQLRFRAAHHIVNIDPVTLSILPKQAVL